MNSELENNQMLSSFFYYITYGINLRNSIIYAVEVSKSFGDEYFDFWIDSEYYCTYFQNLFI